MTEDEAKTKWCPFARSVLIAKDGVDIPTHNRVGIVGHWTADGQNLINCIGSDCMMWIATDNEYEPELPQNMTTAVRVEQQGKPAGRCGLAK